MQIGRFMTMPAPEPRPDAEILSRGIELAVAAEQLGLSHVWLAEHHFTNYAYSSRPLMLLSHIAARTCRIRLGALPQAQVLASMRRFAEHVMPAFAEAHVEEMPA
ncbi:LLM class flavin-dependent oxidoreductase [Trinickia violacea]|uniref:LLM class flavin-dependent oxidoreductase n=1 Tax=Trinickia violacea TaxID=2571746 RepID=A0A4P8ILK4_9BURK|nr:LLM class flavin-dependent oxidoreductase [Trinickia violacea]QCP48647.1 LLM class flavin-dependent oxidoreductase [Trinickia violacea]